MNCYGADPDLFPGIELSNVCEQEANAIPQILMKQPPAWLRGLPPVVEAEHDGEGAGGQQLPFVLVLVIQAVSCGQCKSVPNLGRKQIEVGKK